MVHPPLNSRFFVLGGRLPVHCKKRILLEFLKIFQKFGKIFLKKTPRDLTSSANWIEFTKEIFLLQVFHG